MSEASFERNPDRVYATSEIVVEWEARFCIHSARCIMTLPDVFDPARRPWIVLDGADPDAIATAVKRCPTGALHFRRLDGGPQEEPGPARIVPQTNGPLFVRGDLVVEAEGGGVIRRDTRMALCRCGASEHKPFCDNSHRRIGFRAP